MRVIPLSKTLTELHETVFDETTSMAVWLSSSVAAVSDASLIEACISILAVPKQTARPSSFQLHAPLELLARAALLPHVTPSARDEARRRIAQIAWRYAREGDDLPISLTITLSRDHAESALFDAFASADRVMADIALRSLLARESIDDVLRLLLDPVVPLLGAAAHAPILVGQLQHTARLYAGATQLLRASLSYLLIHHDAHVAWIDAPCHATSESLDESLHLQHILSQPTAIKTPNTNISSTMLAAEHSGGLARDLGGLSFSQPSEVAKILFRVAALSMLQDSAQHAPYGWTHCLTMPFALMSASTLSKDVRRLAKMATTEVYAFRATMGQCAIDMAWRPSPPSRSARNQASPEEAASMAYATALSNDATAMDALRTQLATNALKHHDAHLVKYTHTCFSAASVDPEASALYYAAAAYLVAWWRIKDDQVNEKRSALA